MANDDDTQPENTQPDDPPEAVVIEFDASACDGPGWYYYDGEYPDEGVVGAFKTSEEARAHASAAGYVVAEEETP